MKKVVIIMFAVNTYAEIEKNEKQLDEKHIIVLLFVRPSLSDSEKIIAEFNYLHYNSRKYCSIYAVGYSNDKHEQSYQDYQTVKGVDGADWYYSDRAFVDFKDKLETRLKWKYSGDIELIVLQSNPEGRNILNFENYLAIDVNYGIKNEYIESFPRFMESLIRTSKKEVEVNPTARSMQKAKYKVRDVVASSIDACKKVPQPVKTIIKDRLFYRTSKSYT
jgi:hypothetical protein